MLDALTPELVEIIASDLNLDDLISLRLTCPTLAHKTSRHFFRLSFHIVDTDLTPESVQRLVAVSQHETARHAVQVFRFAATNKCYGVPFGYGVNWRRDDQGRLTGEELSAMVGTLRSAVLRFPNCDEHVVTDNGEMIFEDQEDSDLTFTDVTLIVHSLLAQPGVRVQSFKLNMPASEVALFAPRLDPTLYTAPEFRAAWAGLRKLELRYEMDATITPLLIREAVNIDTLAVCDRGGGTEVAAFALCLATAPRLPRVRSLALSLDGLDEAMLLAVLRPFRETLASLKFTSMTLEGRWSEVMSNIGNGGFSSLESLEFRYIHQHRGPVYFSSLRNTPECTLRAAQVITVFDSEDMVDPVIGVRVIAKGDRMKELLQTDLIDCMDRGP